MIPIGDHQDIMLNPEFLQYINQSCNPNIFFDLSDETVKTLQTSHSKDCLGTIREATSIDILRKYKLAQHIQPLLIKQVSRS